MVPEQSGMAMTGEDHLLASASLPKHFSPGETGPFSIDLVGNTSAQTLKPILSALMKDSRNDWIWDTGAYRSICCNRRPFTSYLPYTIYMKRNFDTEPRAEGDLALGREDENW